MERVTMAEPKDRELDAILKLVKLTQEGTLKWRAGKPWGDLSETDDRKFEGVFTCEYEGRRLRLYVESIRKVEPSLSEFSLFGTKRTYPYWERELVLEITDVDGRS